MDWVVPTIIFDYRQRRIMKRKEAIETQELYITHRSMAGTYMEPITEMVSYSILQDKYHVKFIDPVIDREVDYEGADCDEIGFYATCAGDPITEKQEHTKLYFLSDLPLA